MSILAPESTFMLVLGLLTIALLIVIEPLANDVFADVELESWQVGEGIGPWGEPGVVIDAGRNHLPIGVRHSIWHSLRWPWRQRG